MTCCLTTSLAAKKLGCKDARTPTWPCDLFPISSAQTQNSYFKTCWLRSSAFLQSKAEHYAACSLWRASTLICLHKLVALLPSIDSASDWMHFHIVWSWTAFSFLMWICSTSECALDGRETLYFPYFLSLSLVLVVLSKLTQTYHYKLVLNYRN